MKLIPRIALLPFLLLIFILSYQTDAQAQFEPPQGITIDKVANPTQLPPGGGMVTYTYTLTKNSLLNIVTPTPILSPDDDQCAPLVLDPMTDTGLPLVLDQPGEAWVYTCTANITQSTLNTVVASGLELSLLGGLVLPLDLVVSDEDTAFVEVQGNLCGNGTVDAGVGETCDDSNNVNGDGCDFTCHTETCGNGIVQLGELCDGLNLADTGLCTTLCQLAECGDGFVQSVIGEECEPGLDPLIPCTDFCKISACGDGIIGSFIDGVNGILTEQCDDGNIIAGDGCNITCQNEFCGDDVVQAGAPLNEQCDDGNNVSGDGCSAVCVSESCGDGIVQGATETCDDGNIIAGDGCSATCGSEKCGDSVVQTGGNFAEQCDDGNQIDQDGCSSLCRTETCGDGITQSGLGETCDNGRACNDGSACHVDADCNVGSCLPRSGDGCSATCQPEFCGDGVLQSGNPLNEQCDDGNNVSGDGCSATCVSETCGDGVVQGATETCDDGNNVSGDGCSATCGSEKCGDGVVQVDGSFAEQCDDGNQNDQDGCSSLCRPETCGDGVTQSGLGESCDDGNKVSSDGCSDTCQPEFCGDGVVQANAPLVEQCDPGNKFGSPCCDSACGFRSEGTSCDDGNSDTDQSSCNATGECIGSDNGSLQGAGVNSGGCSLQTDAVTAYATPAGLFLSCLGLVSLGFWTRKKS